MDNEIKPLRIFGSGPDVEFPEEKKEYEVDTKQRIKKLKQTILKMTKLSFNVNLLCFIVLVKITQLIEISHNIFRDRSSNPILPPYSS